MWLIAKELQQPINKALLHADVYPHTVSYCCRKQMQIDSYMELPKEKRPPEDLYDDSEALEDWFDKIFDRKKHSTGIEVRLDEVE